MKVERKARTTRQPRRVVLTIDSEERYQIEMALRLLASRSAQIIPTLTIPHNRADAERELELVRRMIAEISHR